MPSKTSKVSIHHLDHGVTLLCQPQMHAQLASFALAVPAGVMHQPADQVGIAWLLGECLDRGTYALTTHEWMDKLEMLGALQDQSLHSGNLIIECSCPKENLAASLKLCLDAMFRPRFHEKAFDEKDFDACQLLTLQAIECAYDDPSVLGYQELYRAHLPEILGRPEEGEAAHVRAMTLDHVKAYHTQHFHPGHLLVSASGLVEEGLLADELNAYFKAPNFGDGLVPIPIDADAIANSVASKWPNYPKQLEIAYESHQKQLYWAGDAATATHEHRFYDQILSEVMTGGMTGRLFMEMREERGLCYSVETGYTGNRYYGMLYASVGCTKEKVGEVEEVLASECQTLIQSGVESDELFRCVNGLITDYLSGQESGMGRAYGMLGDYERFGQVRSDEEVVGQLASIDLDALNQYLGRKELFHQTKVTVG